MWFFRIITLVMAITVGMIMAGPFKDVYDAIREAIPFSVTSFDTAIMMMMPLFFLVVIVFIMPLIRFLRGTDEFTQARKKRAARKSLLAQLPRFGR